MQKITFVIPSRNNLEFLKLAYQSIRKLSYTHDILILDDASVDNTTEWIKSLNDPDIIYYQNPGPKRIGIVGMFDKGIEMSRTEIIFAFHADMIAGPNLDVNVLKHLTPGSIVSATRIEPPLHPPGPEKITKAWGNEVHELQLDNIVRNIEELEQQYNNKTTEGIFAPWCMYKKDYLEIGGHDALFAPQSKEDSDLFNRFVLNGYNVIQAWDVLVYHFTSRGSRFNKHAGGHAGQNSPEWEAQNQRSTKNFIRKWGHFVKHNEYMKPIIPHKYNIHCIIHNCNHQLLQLLEPWFSCTYTKNTYGYNWADYRDMEQANTLFDMSKRVNDIDVVNKDNIDILVEFDANRFTQQTFNIIQNLSDIITDSGEIGEFDLDCLKITIANLKTYEHELVVNKQNNI